MFNFEILNGSKWRVTAWESVGHNDVSIDLPMAYEGEDLTWDEVGSAVDNIIHHINDSNGLMWTSEQLFECEPGVYAWENKDRLLLGWGYMLGEDDPVNVIIQVDRV